MSKSRRSIDVREIGFVTARLEIDYRHPAQWGQKLQIDVELIEVGSSSFTTEYEIRDAETGGLIVEAESVQVVTLDREEGGPMPDDIRDSLITFCKSS
jgi:acyl-CoA thioesterase FadM